MATCLIISEAQRMQDKLQMIVPCDSCLLKVSIESHLGTLSTTHSEPVCPTHYLPLLIPTS